MHRVIGAALVAATSLISSPSYADEEEIVVTATRTPTAIARLPARIEVIGRDDIEAGALATLPEALGPQAVQSGGVGQQTSLFLRGADSNHVLALLDGVRLNDASSPDGQYDFGQDTLPALDRIEVLRGPASALYGSEAIGGVVNLIPRRGGATAFEPFLELAAGSLGSRRLALGAAGSAAALEYGLSADLLQTDGYDLTPARMSTHTGDTDGASLATATLSARARQGSASFDVLARVRSSSAEYDTFAGGPLFDLRADDPDLSNDAQQSLWRLGVENSFASALTMRIAGGRVRSDRSENDNGAVTASAQSSRDFIEATARIGWERTTATAGISFERNEIENRPQYALPLSIAEGQRAAFAVGQFDLTNRAVATVSARWDWNERYGEYGTYSAGLVATFEPIRLYASAGTGFKAPSLSERYETNFWNIGNPDLLPERSRSWEAGADWRLGALATLGATYYRTRISDLIEFQFVELGYVNIGEAEIEGAEIRVEASPFSWAAVRVAYDWTDARNGQTGARLLRRPEHSWRISAELTPIEGTRVVLSWADVGRRRDVTYGDGGEFLSGAGVADSWGAGSIAASYNLGERAEAFLRIDNVTDEVYEQPAAFAGGPRTTMIGIRAGL